MGSLISAPLGYMAASDQLAAASQARNQALSQYLNIHPPTIAEQELALQQYQNAGTYNPEMLQNIQAGPSSMEGIQLDPRLVNAQMAALQQLSQTGQMGMTPAEAAALQQVNRESQALAQAKSEQILDNMARRGMGGSGAELAAQLQNAQSAADRASQQGGQTAQAAQQQALQALAQSGQLAGQIGAQQFGQQADIARAKDYINQFNTANTINNQRQNVAATNDAALKNLMSQQNLMNMNTQLSNQQQQYNKQLLQQQFNNQMALASGRAGQYQGVAQNAQQQAGRTADMYAGIGQGIDTGIGAIYSANQNSGQPSQQQNPGYSSGYGQQGLSDSEMQGGWNPNYGSYGADQDLEDFSSIFGV